MIPVKKSDLNLSVVATSTIAGCGLLAVLYALVVAVGGDIGRRGHFIGMSALVLGIAVHCTVGYVTGRSARAKRAPVNFHVIFVGVLVMLLSLVVLKAPLVGANPRHWGEYALMLRVINILLTIPAMWLGANWHQGPVPDETPGANSDPRDTSSIPSKNNAGQPVK